MSVTYSGGSLKELHKRKKSIEDLTKENEEALKAALDEFVKKFTAAL